MILTAYNSKICLKFFVDVDLTFLSVHAKYHPRAQSAPGWTKLSHKVPKNNGKALDLQNTQKFEDTLQLFFKPLLIKCNKTQLTQAKIGQAKPNFFIGQAYIFMIVGL